MRNTPAKKCHNCKNRISSEQIRRRQAIKENGSFFITHQGVSAKIKTEFWFCSKDCKDKKENDKNKKLKN